MKQRLVFLTITIGVFAVSFLARNAFYEGDGDTGQGRPGQVRYHRIVSLAPSITEILFATGLGDSVVGVTRFCNFPPKAQSLPKVGGYFDPNYEAILRLDPDLVIMLAEHQKAREYFRRINRNVLVVSHQTTDGVLKSIMQIGHVCQAQEEAGKLVDGIEAVISEVQNQVDYTSPPSILITVGHNYGSGKLDQVYIAGRDGFYDSLVKLAGGINAYRGVIRFPVVSGEGILELDPDIIIDLVPELGKNGLTKENVIRDWQSLGDLQAVRNERVYVTGEAYAVIPGPRFVLILKELAQIISTSKRVSNAR